MAADNDANQTYYGKPVETKAILFDHRVPRRPDEAATLMSALP
jgi:hypothetical protein